MKTTLAKLSVCVILLLVVSCARKASIYSDLFSTLPSNNFIENDVIQQKSVASNSQTFLTNNNIGSFTGYRSVSFNNSNGVSASASASVNIIDPATLSLSEEIVFQKISLKNLKNKFVSLNEIGANYQRIVVPNTYANTAQNLAKFNIAGGYNRALDITVPNQIMLYHQNGNDVLSALINTQNCLDNSEDLNNFMFTIDGKIYFNALANPGIYSSKDFTVTVNYN
jgi:hypothetical protein